MKAVEEGVSDLRLRAIASHVGREEERLRDDRDDVAASAPSVNFSNPDDFVFWREYKVAVDERGRARTTYPDLWDEIVTAGTGATSTLTGANRLDRLDELEADIRRLTRDLNAPVTDEFPHRGDGA